MLPGRLILDLPSTTLNAQDMQRLHHPAVGGVILFKRNIQDRQQLSLLTAEIRAIRPELLLAIDQEGGRVQRWQSDTTSLPPMRYLGQLYSQQPQAACQASRLLGQLMAAELRSVGIDLSFAPVLDLDYQTSQVIGDRAFASQAEIVISLAGAFIEGMQLQGMAAVGKHFPGHGYVTADSHLEVPLDSRSWTALSQQCLQPFAALSPCLQGIMPAHVIYSQIDSLPAGFSPFWLGYLRHTLGFNGLIFSDDLSMEGAKAVGNDCCQRAAAAFAAGCDLILVCNHPEAAMQVADWMQAQHIDPCDGLLALKGRQPNQAWLTSPEALLARQVAAALNSQDWHGCINLFI